MALVGEQIVFGPFCLDTSSDCLLREGGAVPLRPQAFRALRALVANSGRHLDHEQMTRQAWDGTVVSKHTVTVTVGEVKKALGEFGVWIRCHPRLGYCLEVPESEELLRTGWHFLNRHTREGLEKAIDCFEQAARHDGAEIRALEGISLSHLLLGAHGMRPPGETYSRFLDAYQRVVEIRGLTTELKIGRAFGLHIFERRFADAEALLLQAELERPKDAVVYVRLAMLYVAWKRMDEAVATLAKARAADALSPILAMAEILVRFCRRDYEAAAAYGRKVVDLHPYLQQVMTFYANALEFSGRMDEALRQYRQGCVVAPDLPWLRAMEGACLAKAGRTREAQEILHELRVKQQTDYVDGYHVALLLHALGRADEAFLELERAFEEGCPILTMLDADPKMDPLRSDPRFAPLRQKLFQDVSARRAEE